MKQENWISANDRLPENTADVIVFDGSEVSVSWYSHNAKKWYLDFREEVHHITHWMPLPDSPKQEKQLRRHGGQNKTTETMEKTRMQWFEEAKANGAEWVDAAIRNTLDLSGGSRLYKKKESLLKALGGAFLFMASPEGQEYWRSICEKIKQEERAKNNA